MTHKIPGTHLDSLHKNPDIEREPIAIIGIGCRFPGGANDPKAFWQMLVNGTDAITDIPDDRMDLASYYDTTPATPGKIASRQGGFLDKVDQFDAYFFGVSPREANYMDPQQRLLLETTWEALEDAGQVTEDLKESQTGVFIGMWANDYAEKMYKAAEDINLYITTGGGRYAASGRISYFFGFNGPSLTVDTACSSSLVTVHLACQSLRGGESTLAIAGGVNIILEPAISIGYSRSKMLSPDGRCKFGDVRANGYVRSEGVGIVVLKRLSQALADNDRIYAVIRGSAVNNDGRSSELLVAPGVGSQIKMLHEAYQNAGVDPLQVGYVEAHGTGTPVGDPVELEALGTVLSENRDASRTLRVGSVKTNIGHAEAASGVAGLIKTALILKHRAIPPSLHFKDPNPKIPWGDLHLQMQTELAPWPDAEGPAFAAVNSFGITGTNAHIVLEEAPQTEKTPADKISDTPYLLPLSAQTPEALNALVDSYLAFLSEAGATSLQDICYTASCRHVHQAVRLAVVGRSHQELVEQLSLHKTNGLQHRRNVEKNKKTAFVFSGQGPQWLGMGRELMKTDPLFCAKVLEIDRLLQRYVNWSLMDQLNASEEHNRLSETEVAQPAIFAMQVGLAEVWKRWGIEPDAVIGHSVGEIAAAHIAGVLSLEDAVRVVYHRSRLMQLVTGQGRMAALGISPERAEEVIAHYSGLSIGAINSPTSTVLSGDGQALEEIVASLSARGTFARMMPVNYAFHSPVMDQLTVELVKALDGLTVHPARIGLYSTVSGEQAGEEDYGASYWARNIRQPVLFSNAVGKLLEDEHQVFIEISPHPVLLSSIQEFSAATHQQAYGFASLRRNQPEVSTLLGEVGSLYSIGYSVDWHKLYPDGGSVVSLPTYPWQRERFWYETETSSTRFAPLVPEREITSSRDLTDWLYEVQWKLAPPTEETPESSTKPGSWLIFADEKQISKTLANLLGTQGHRCILVSQGNTWEAEKNDHFRIDPENAEHVHRLLTTALDEKAPSCQGIVYLWGVDIPEISELDAAALESAQVRNSASLLHLVQTVSQLEWKDRPRLWVITRGAQSVVEQPSSSISPLQASLWGLSRVIAKEHPEFWGGIIDLDPGEEPIRSAKLLRTEMIVPGGNEVAFRDGQRYAAQLVHLVQTPNGNTASFQWRTDGSYLITGGLGEVGIQLASWMVKQGARRIILMSRTPIPARDAWRQIDPASAVGRKIAAIQSLEALGASVHLASVDVSDEKQLVGFLQNYQRENWPPIRGVFHLAGTIQDDLLLRLDAESLRSVMRPKIMGAWLLHRVFQDVDCFVLFSSIGALLGQMGQGNYATANAFLDGLAHYRRQCGQRALSINWGFWKGLGFAASAGGQRTTQQLEQQGMQSFGTEDGLQALKMLLDNQQDHQQVAVLPMDRSLMRQAGPVHGSLLRNLLVEDNQNETQPSVENQLQQHSFREELFNAHSEQQIPLLKEYLQSQIARILRLPVNKVSTDQTLGSYGLDSLMTVELRNRLEADLGIKLPATLVWNYPTIDRMSPYLLEKLSVLMEANTMDVETAVLEEEIPQLVKHDALFADIDDLSDDEALQSLLGK